jgi:TonB-linked SusC/RagA family outer membrane protein
MNFYTFCMPLHAYLKPIINIILIMKLMVLLIIVTCLQASATGYAQKINLSERNIPLEKVFTKIENQTGYLFWYENQILAQTTNIDIDVKNATLEKVLDKCLKDQKLTYSIVNKTVVIKMKQLPEARPIRGTVRDSTGFLPNVTITVKNRPKMGTSTDANGKYLLNVPDDDAVLVFQMIGYVTKEVPVKGKEVIDVILVESPFEMDEAVVVAFGTQKRTDMVGSVTSVKPSDLKVPSSNLTTALSGRVAGIIGYQRSGEPGQDNADFFIRGVTSFGTGKVNPLILIDGVELSVTELARMRPDDIESFSVMKDATATALYGARGANGVIYVTTKEGKEGAATISFRAESSVSTATSDVQLADPVTYMTLYNEATQARDPFAQPYYPQEKIDGTANGLSPIIFPATDWRKALFKDHTFNQRYNMNLSGGGKVARYYVAGSMAQDNGVLKVDRRNNFTNNIDLKSFTLRANVNINVTKSTELIVRLNGNFDDYTGPIDGGADLYNKVIRTSPVDFLPYYPVDEDHISTQHIMFGGLGNNKTFLNPYADMVKGYKDYSRSLMLAQLEAKQDLSFLTPGLSFRTMMNTNRISRFDIVRAYKPFFYELTSYDKKTMDYKVDIFNEDTGAEYLDFAMPAKEQSTVFYLESALNYAHIFGDKHAFSGLLVHIMRSNIDANGANLQLSLPSRNVGLSGRATYAYDKRYFAEFNFGYNGSERFYQDKRFGFFPSAGIAWSISNEKFWEPVKNIVNNFRLRATYGLVGNDAIGSATDRFFYLSNVNMNDAARKGQFGREYGYRKDGITVTRYSNEDITWETSEKTNLAVELGLFNKINIQADFFAEHRKNILMTRADIPSTMGLSANVRANLGEATGKGMDISADYQHNFSKRMWLQVRGNFTYATNKYKVYEEPSYENEWWKSRIGLPLSQPTGYIAERLFVDDSEVGNSPLQNFGAKNIAGDIKYKDVNGDGEITALDKVPIGYPTVPEIVYGLGFSLGYKGFDVSTFIQGLSRVSFWVDPEAVQPFVAGGRQIIKAYADSHFSPENQDLIALWPRLSPTSHANNIQESTWWLKNGAFLRVKQIEIGWTLPQKTADRIRMKNMRIYLNGSNLFTLSHFKLWDIEMGSSGLGYPVQKVFNIGMNVTF